MVLLIFKVKMGVDLVSRIGDIFLLEASGILKCFKASSGDMTNIESTLVWVPFNRVLSRNIFLVRSNCRQYILTYVSSTHGSIRFKGVKCILSVNYSHHGYAMLLSKNSWCSSFL